jgi:hypothetical protein
MLRRFVIQGVRYRFSTRIWIRLDGLSSRAHSNRGRAAAKPWWEKVAGFVFSVGFVFNVGLHRDGLLDGPLALLAGLITESVRVVSSASRVADC